MNDFDESLFEDFQDITDSANADQNFDPNATQSGDFSQQFQTQDIQGQGVQDDKSLVLNDDINTNFGAGFNVPSLDFSKAEDEMTFADMLKNMATQNGYSIVLIILHILVMLAIGLGVFFILYSAI